jgi:hypothetical protein
MDGSEPDEHDYRACADENCPAELCQIYKAGWRKGHDDGHAAGEAEGHVAGYGEGHKDSSR